MKLCCSVTTEKEELLRYKMELSEKLMQVSGSGYPYSVS
jgi:hypothetical protein